MGGAIAECMATMDVAADLAAFMAAARLARVRGPVLPLPGGCNADLGPQGDVIAAG